MISITNKRNLIELSVKTLDYNPENNTFFTVESIKLENLEATLKSQNFSLIQWSGSRCTVNFKSASGFTVDIENGMTIDEAEEILKNNNLNFALITSKRHSDQLNRFHILIPFDRKVYTLENYKVIVSRIKDELFPNLDECTLDGARYIFGSPDEAIFKSIFNRCNYKVDGDQKVISTFIDGKQKNIYPQIENAWNDGLEITNADGEITKAMEAFCNNDNEKVNIYCPFHDDNNPSALLSYSDENYNYYIHCSSCKKTFWKLQTKDIIALKCKNFFSYQTGVNEAAIVGDKFFLESIGKEKFFIRAGATSKDEQNKYFEYITKYKHIQGLNRIDHIGDVTIESSEYITDLDKGLITVKIKAIPEKIADNVFIEDYLTKVFGQYKPFIKEWLAVYCYTNYRKLPTLILTGERGSGKNTFAEPIYEIFPTLSGIVKDINSDFNPNAEQKLMIIDESDSKGKLQYQTLKKLSGQKYVEINKKYVPHYQVWNNLNVIFLSNEELPIYVEREELPTDESNNQFFVYRFSKLSGVIDANLQNKIIDRLGHYIRTELKAVFEGLSLDGYRYSIRVPITEDEKKLFGNSLTEEEAEADRVIDNFESNVSNKIWIYYPFVQAGYLPSEFIDEVLANRKNLKSKVIQNLKKRNYLDDSSALRYQAGNRRLYCQKLGQVWLGEVKSQNNSTPPKRVAVPPFEDSHLSHNLAS